MTGAVVLQNTSWSKPRKAFLGTKNVTRPIASSFPLFFEQPFAILNFLLLPFFASFSVFSRSGNVTSGRTSSYFRECVRCLRRLPVSSMRARLLIWLVLFFGFLFYKRRRSVGIIHNKARRVALVQCSGGIVVVTGMAWLRCVDSNEFLSATTQSPSAKWAWPRNIRREGRRVVVDGSVFASLESRSTSFLRLHSSLAFLGLRSEREGRRERERERQREKLDDARQTKEH